MNITSLKIPDVKLIEPDIFEDDRGYFYELYNQKKFNEAIGRNIFFVQQNISKSKKNVLRGLHYQEEPFSQAKLINVSLGEVFDVFVDIRKTSKTFGQWGSEILSAENKKQLWIPEGFAHGFLVLSNIAVFNYSITNYYAKQFERSIIWNDADLQINWPKKNDVIISDKDKMALPFKEI